MKHLLNDHMELLADGKASVTGAVPFYSSHDLGRGPPHLFLKLMNPLCPTSKINFCLLETGMNIAILLSKL